jgi:hypothetical protein
MALPNPSPGDVIRAAHIDEVREHLEGASGSTAPYHLRQSTGNFIITLPDAAGATKLRLNDSGGTEVFSVDSDGTITHSGTYVPATFTLPVSASPAPTVEGRTIWDSDDNYLSIGNGSATQVFFSDDKGSDLASNTTITPTQGHFYHVTGTTTVTGISTKPAGLELILYFESALTLTHHATSFILRESKSRQTVPGEIVRFVSEGSGNWREVSTGTTAPLSASSTQTNDTTTLASSTFLTQAVVANAVYSFEARLIYISPTAADFKIALLGPANAYANYYVSRTFTDGVYGITLVTDTDMSAPNATSMIGLGTTLNTNIVLANCSGVVVTGATAGTVAMQFAELSASGTSTLLAGSMMQLTRTA